MCLVATYLKKTNPEINKHIDAPRGTSYSPNFLDLAVLHSTARSKEQLRENSLADAKELTAFIIKKHSIHLNVAQRSCFSSSGSSCLCVLIV